MATVLLLKGKGAYRGSIRHHMASENHPTVDTTLELLSYPRHRLILQYFKQYPNPVDLDRLAVHVARWEADAGTEPAPGIVDTVRSSLDEAHLPRFEAAELVEYDPATETVQYDPVSISMSIQTVREVLGFLWHADAIDE